MNKRQAKAILQGAMLRLLQEDFDEAEAFPHGIGERPIVFRLANYMIALDAEQDGLRVDCDYNRHRNAVKTFLQPKEETLRDSSDSVKPKRFFPDIVLHERGSDERNTLVCEIKKADDPRGQDIDCGRLRELTRLDGEYCYALGAFVNIDQAALRISVTYFEDGRSTASETIYPSGVRRRTVTPSG